MSESEEKMIQIKHKLAKNVWEREENKKHGVSTFLDPEFEIEDMLFLFEEIARLEQENKSIRRECIQWQELAHSLIPDA